MYRRCACIFLHAATLNGVCYRYFFSCYQSANMSEFQAPICKEYQKRPIGEVVLSNFHEPCANEIFQFDILISRLVGWLVKVEWNFKLYRQYYDSNLQPFELKICICTTEPLYYIRNIYFLFKSFCQSHLVKEDLQ